MKRNCLCAPSATHCASCCTEEAAERPGGRLACFPYPLHLWLWGRGAVRMLQEGSKKSAQCEQGENEGKQQWGMQKRGGHMSLPMRARGDGGRAGK